jgi:hypothetical protein
LLIGSGDDSIVDSLKTMKNSSMATTRKTPDFLKRLLKETAKECSSEEEAIHSAEPCKERQRLCISLLFT